jgi:hypothetical protein
VFLNIVAGVGAISKERRPTPGKVFHRAVDNPVDKKFSTDFLGFSTGCTQCFPQVVDNSGGNVVENPVDITHNLWIVDKPVDNPCGFVDNSGFPQVWTNMWICRCPQPVDMLWIPWPTRPARPWPVHGRSPGAVAPGP